MNSKQIMCYQCSPVKPMEDHKSLYGVIIHERIDCEKDTIYMLNENQFELDYQIDYLKGKE